MADKDKKGKGLPRRAAASHPKHAKRQGHKARAQLRHDRNRLEQAQREADNNALRELGLSTPWEVACAKRNAERAASR